MGKSKFVIMIVLSLVIIITCSIIAIREIEDDEKDGIEEERTLFIDNTDLTIYLNHTKIIGSNRMPPYTPDNLGVSFLKISVELKNENEGIWRGNFSDGSILDVNISGPTEFILHDIDQPVGTPPLTLYLDSGTNHYINLTYFCFEMDLVEGIHRIEIELIPTGQIFLSDFEVGFSY